MRHVCNGRWNCPGGQDERNCLNRTCPGRFKCHNSTICIALESICDGIPDCILHDEDNFCHLSDCPIHCNCLLNSICQNTSEIIPIYYMCDGFAHCALEDDEHECQHTCYNSSQSPEGIITPCFSCKNGKSISIVLLNNGITDCPLHDDETFHFIRKATVPDDPEEKCIYDKNNNKYGTSHCLFYECPYHFKCLNTYCIPYKYICDNVYDCPRGDDELQSLCHNITCYDIPSKPNG